MGRARVSYSVEAIRDLLFLLPDTVILGMEFDAVHNTINFHVIGDGYPDVIQGGEAKSWAPSIDLETMEKIRELSRQRYS